MNKIFDLIKNSNFEVFFSIIVSLLSVSIKIYYTKFFDPKKKEKKIKIQTNKSNGDRIIGDKVIVKDYSPRNIESTTKSKPKVLKVFVIVALLYLILTIALNWDNIVITRNTILLYVGLFLMMCGGMFVSVIRKNYKDDKELFDVRDSDLIYPLLFSVFVFYPLLIMVDTEQNSKLLFYTAFLNGYFWKTIVTEAEEDRKLKKEKL